LIVANQFTTQLTDEIREAVFGNVGTIVAFRVGDHDVDSLAKYFSPTFDGSDLLKIPNHNTVVRTLIGGVPTNAFSMSTIPPLGSPNYQLAEALKQLSAAKYGRPRAKVEAEIFERLATKTPPPAPTQPSAPRRFGSNPFGPAPNSAPAFNPPQPQFAPPAQQPTSASAPAQQGSFLDQWLSKRQPASTAKNPFAAPAAPPISHHNTAFRSGFGGGASVPSPAPSTQAYSYGNRNISSNSLEQAEVDTIAHEIKNAHPHPQLAVAPPAATPPKVPAFQPSSISSPSSQPQPVSVAKPEGTSAQQPPAAPIASAPVAAAPKNYGEVSLREAQHHEDTIFIDKDGNLTSGESN